MTDVFEGLDAVPWSTLQAAYGPADAVPDLIRRATLGDVAASIELWDTVWHQGTVYECTPVAVPFLVRSAIEPSNDDESRSQAAFLLASIAAATSYVLPGHNSGMQLAAWLREPGVPVPSRDLAAGSWSAVAAFATPVAKAVAGSPPATRAGLVAVLAAVASVLTTDDLEALRTPGGDPLLDAAVGLVGALATNRVSEAGLSTAAALDEGVADWFPSIADWPLTVRAVELVRELCERATSSPPD